MAARTEEGKPREQSGKQQGQRPERAMTASRSGDVMPYRRDPLHFFRDNMNRLFERFFSGSLFPYEGMERESWGMDVREEDGAVVVRAEAPGFEPDDFDLQVRGDQLILHARRKSESEEKERGYREWRQQEFYRSVPLPVRGRHGEGGCRVPAWRADGEGPLDRAGQRKADPGQGLRHVAIVTRGKARTGLPDLSSGR
jgi:HSP20 family protein